MKWINKGHEFDRYWESLDIPDNESFYIGVFGAGYMGRSIMKRIKSMGLPTKMLFIDNDVAKQNEVIDNCPVFLPGAVDKRWRTVFVIPDGVKYKDQMISQLEDMGLRESYDFFVFDEFYSKTLPVIAAYLYDRFIITDHAQISLTERCTLKCRDCCHGCFSVPMNAEDMSFEKVKASADIFFEYVDHINDFYLLGGEPLLYKYLEDTIDYIGINYRNQINNFAIITNGSISPRETLLEKCKRFDVSFKISDYTKSNKRLIPLLNEFVEKLKAKQICYTKIIEDGNWIDFELGKVENSKDEAVQIFNNCKTPCREIRGDRIYYCIMARSFAENTHMAVDDDGYINLKELDGVLEAKKILLEYNNGFSGKGYIDMCRYCNGMNTTKTVIAGIQLA